MMCPSLSNQIVMLQHVGAVLAHVYPDGSEQPIERNYAQIKKEGLTLIWGREIPQIHLWSQVYSSSGL